MSASSHVPRHTRALFGIALLLLLLGAGNVVYANRRIANFQRLLLEANAELASPLPPRGPHRHPTPLLGSLNVDNETKHIARLKAQIDFYNLVILGGRVFLAIAGILGLAGLLLLRRGDDPPAKGETA